jgi:PAS domain S-box-containing protein
MANKKATKSELRSKAEAKVKKIPENLKDLSILEVGALLHELEVHQIELEMQNQELREIQHRLEEVKDRYTDLFDFAPVGYLLLDEKGIIKNINLTGCGLFGKDRLQLKGKPLSAFMSRADANKLYLQLKEAFKTGILPSFELIIKNQNGSTFMAMLQGLVSKEDDHKASLCRISLQDVTELHKATELKRKHEDLLREKENIQQYLELAPVIFVLIDTEHRVQMINQKGCDALGCNRLDILGKNWFENFLQDAEENGQTLGFKNFNQHKLLMAPYFESYLKNKNGGVSLIAWRNTSLLDKSGNILGTLSAGEDITERKKRETSNKLYTKSLEDMVTERTKELSDALENEKQINELKTAFVSIASHELRTPITIVMSSIILIEKYLELGQYEKQKRHIDRIKSSVDHFTSILDDFLSLDKLERGIVRVIKEKVDIQWVMRAVIEEMGGMLKPGQQINYSHAGNGEAILDKKIVRNILVNLLSNAIKYSDSVIDLSTEVGAGQVTIQVKDQGIGIPEQEQQHLFKRFYRAKNVEHIQGTGLGLSIVERYLQFMGGTIEFTSQLNRGSVFTIRLPQEVPTINFQ